MKNYDARFAGSRMLFREDGNIDTLFLDIVHIVNKGYLMIASADNKVGAIEISKEENTDNKTIKKIAKSLSIEDVKDVLNKIGEQLPDYEIEDFINEITLPILKRG